MFYKIVITDDQSYTVANNVFWVTNGIEDNLLVNQNEKNLGFPKSLCTPKYMVEEGYLYGSFAAGHTFACNADTFDALLAMTEEYVRREGYTWTVKEHK